MHPTNSLCTVFLVVSIPIIRLRRKEIPPRLILLTLFTPMSLTGTTRVLCGLSTATMCELFSEVSWIMLLGEISASG